MSLDESEKSWSRDLWAEEMAGIVSALRILRECLQSPDKIESKIAELEARLSALESEITSTEAAWTVEAGRVRQAVAKVSGSA